MVKPITFDDLWETEPEEKIERVKRNLELIISKGGYKYGKALLTDKPPFRYNNGRCNKDGKNKRKKTRLQE